MLYRDYRRIEGYEDKYVISNYGEVFSLKRKRVIKTIQMKPCPDDRGYLMVTLSKDRKHKTNKVHVLVGKAFVGERTGELTYDHIDRDKVNNRADNIRLATIKQQMDNKGDYKNNKLGVKYIRIYKTPQGIEQYAITIQRTINGKKRTTFTKSFSTRKYTLDDVIKFRDDYLRSQL